MVKMKIEKLIAISGVPIATESNPQKGPQMCCLLIQQGNGTPP